MKFWPNAVGLNQFAGGSIDLRDQETLRRILSSAQPELVLHLAGLSFVPDATRYPRKAYEVNFIGTLNLLEALAETGFKGRMLYISSGDTYGLVPAEFLPLTENHLLRPRNPYAVSKAAAEALCFQWSQTATFEIIIARAFNHIGPGQSDRFVVADFAKQIVEMACGHREHVISVGNIDVTRDFSDVSDVLRAYDALLHNGINGESYNVCSGRETNIRSVLETLLELADIPARISVDPNRWRPTEQIRIYGSHEKLSTSTGWRPTQDLRPTLQKILDNWKEKIG